MERSNERLDDLDSAVERDKYLKVWEDEKYREYSPGESIAYQFLILTKPKGGASIIDFGAGTGRASLIFHNIGLDVQMVDIAENCLDRKVRKEIGKKLAIANLWDLHLPLAPSEYGFCTDVMEHIPPKYVNKVLKNIFLKSEKVFFNISLVEDEFGKKHGEPLHLTVQDFGWWKAKLSEYGKLKEARDLVNSAVFYVTR